MQINLSHRGQLWPLLDLEVTTQTHNGVWHLTLTRRDGRYTGAILFMAEINSPSIWPHLPAGNICKASLDDSCAFPILHSPEERRAKHWVSGKQKIIAIGRQLSSHSEPSLVFKVCCVQPSPLHTSLFMYQVYHLISSFLQKYLLGAGEEAEAAAASTSPQDLFTTGALWCSQIKED